MGTVLSSKLMSERRAAVLVELQGAFVGVVPLDDILIGSDSDERVNEARAGRRGIDLLKKIVG